MASLRWILSCGAIAVWLLFSGAAVVSADPFTASYSDGNTWDTIYAQGFNLFVNDGLAPGDDRTFGDTANLTRWEFYKSGEADAASNIKLAIISAVLGGQTGMYADLTGLNVNDPNGAVVGISTNTIASTAGIATGAPIRFNFDNLELVIGDLYYGALLVNEDEAGNLTPVLVSALTADYIETDPNVFIPETNYDASADPNGRLPSQDLVDFFTSTSNFINPDMTFGTFLFGFSGGGDANFTAYFDTVFLPEGPPGDFDGDTDVDGNDLALWEADYGVNGESDADEDGDTDGLDFLIWQRNYTGPLVPIAAVPEPSSMMLACALVAGGTVARGWSRRRKS